VPVSKEGEQRLLAEKKTITWTLRANNQAVTIPANLRSAYAIDALKEPTVGNTPPVLRFEGAPASGTGPLGAKTSVKAIAGTPLMMKFSVTDDMRALPPEAYSESSGFVSRRRCGHHLRCDEVGPQQRRRGRCSHFAEPGENLASRSERYRIRFSLLLATGTFRPPSPPAATPVTSGRASRARNVSNRAERRHSPEAPNEQTQVVQRIRLVIAAVAVARWHTWRLRHRRRRT
jgi:hypothetical protein